MNPEEELLQLKRQIEKVAKERDRAEWEKAKCLETLQQYGVSTSEEALAEASRLEASVEGLEAQGRQLIEQVRERYGQLLKRA